MKPLRAVAPAPEGWYLMVLMVQIGRSAVSDTPPDSTAAKTSRSKRGRMHYISFRSRVEPKAPLSKWMMAYYSDSLRRCQAVLRKPTSAGKRNSKPPTGMYEKQLAKWKQMDQMLFANAKCVASDDPRLKGNKHIRMFQSMTPQFRAGVFRRLERELKIDRRNRK